MSLEVRLPKRKAAEAAPTSGDLPTSAATAAGGAAGAEAAAAKRGRRGGGGAPKSPGSGSNSGGQPAVQEAPVNGCSSHALSRASLHPSSLHRGPDAESKEDIIRSEIPKSVVKVRINLRRHGLCEKCVAFYACCFFGICSLLCLFVSLF